MDAYDFDAIRCQALDLTAILPQVELGHDDTVHPGAAQYCDGVNNDCDDPAWPEEPLFYASFPSITDSDVSPDGKDAHSGALEEPFQTLDRAQVDAIFADARRREPRPAWTGSPTRLPSDQPPVLSKKEMAASRGNGHVPAEQAEPVVTRTDGSDA